MYVLFFKGCHNKILHTGWLNFMFSQIWRLEVQDPGAIYQSWFLMRDLFLVCRHPSFFLVFRGFFMCQCKERKISGASHSFYKDTSPYDLI